MKRILLIAFALLFSLCGFSKNTRPFKTVTKKAYGSTQVSFTYITISHGKILKSASLSSIASFPITSKLKTLSSTNNGAILNLKYHNDSPIFFERKKTELKTAQIKAVEEQYYSFFENSKEITGIDDPVNELFILKKSKDELGITHVKAQQYYKGIKIYGAESYLHIGPAKDVFTGHLVSLKSEIETTPVISGNEAIKTTITLLKSKTIVEELSKKEKEILEYDNPENELVIYEGKLAYKILIRPNFIELYKCFVDAINGEVLFLLNSTCTDGPVNASGYDLTGTLRTFKAYLENGTYMLINASESMYNPETQEGLIMTFDANNTSTEDLDYSMITSTNNTWNSPAAVSVHYNSAKTYQYFSSTFGRNSINGEGGNIISLINVANEDGSSMENAFWNGKAAFYGNGGARFESLAGGMDITAHELGHGVVSSTANLEYYGQSGAINETYADIFGSMVDRDDWLIGEDVTKTSYSPSGAIRNMANPHNLGSSLNDPYWQPNHVKEMYIGEDDNAGVHVNSGIGNHAFYLIATEISKEKAEKIFYIALTNYLTSKSQFIDLRIAVIQAAKNLYGDSSTEATAAENAFDAVGIYDEVQNNYEQEYPVNPGQEYLLSYDTDDGNVNTLYRSSTEGTNYYSLSQTLMKGKVSVTDDGNYAVYVASDDRMMSITTNPFDIQENILSNDFFWDNVAVSKDGNRLAAISTEIDTAIYVYDFVSEQWAKFILYNPTTSHDNMDAGGVLFADVIEFDHTGEYLIYDAYNEISTTGSWGSWGEIGYWDIGFIKVWDTQSNTFGDGTINKLYGSLPENVSIGNPTFSKNSPYIIAFDYFNPTDDEYAIIGANLLSGEIDVITTNSIIGYPSFSKNDDKIAYSALTTYDLPIVATIDLESNKITGSGDPSIIVENGQWPVYYTVGNRNLGLAPEPNFTADIKSGYTPLTVQFIDLSVNEPSSWSWSFPAGNPSTSNLKNPVVTYNTPGVYTVTLTCSNGAGNNSITKTSYITVIQGNGLDEFETEFSIYPNPTNGKLFVDAANVEELRIFSISGKELLSVTEQNQIDLKNLKAGIYVLKATINGNLVIQKIAKQ